MKHCILAKFIDGVNAEDKIKLKEEIEEVFAPVMDIEGVYKVEVIENVIDRPNRYDILIRIEMDKEALVIYDGCDAHHTWKDNYGKLLAKKAIFDYE